jgi:4a-hydroxytetrahydrobiopterin dehydratase
MLMTNDEIVAGLATLPAWRREETELVRELSFADFAAALAFVNKVGQMAEAVDHHPDILLHGWNKVRLTLMTHSEGGLTRRDFDLAASIESYLAGQTA